MNTAIADSFYEKILGEAFDPKTFGQRAGYHTKRRRYKGRMILHRHRHTKMQHAALRGRMAEDGINSFTRTKMRERSFMRQIFPTSWPDNNRQAITLTRTSPNGAGYRLRFVDLQRPTGAMRDLRRFGGLNASDLVLDMRAIIKTGGVREEGPDVVYETYDQFWLQAAIAFLNTRGYEVR